MNIPALDTRKNLFDIFDKAQQELGALSFYNALQKLNLDIFFDWIQTSWATLSISALLICLSYLFIGKAVKQTENRTDTWSLLRWHSLRALRTYIVPLLVCAAIIVFQLIFRSNRLEEVIPLAFFIAIFVFWIVLDTFLCLHGASKTLVPLPDLKYRTIRISAKALSFLGLVYFMSAHAMSLPLNILFLLQSCIIILGSLLAMYCVTQIAALAQSERRARKISLLANTVLLTCIIGEVGGYTAYSRWVFFGTLGTLSLLGLWTLGLRLIKDISKALQTPEHHWHQQMTRVFHLKPENTSLHIPWLAFMAQCIFALVILFGILAAWGLSRQSVAWLQTTFINGFAIGKSTIVPLKIIIGIVVFIIILNVGRGIARRIGSGSLLRHRLDSSAIETMAKMTTYIGFMLAALIGLTMAGFNFQNLAIIAGALSVGIGFGLQNIVNNFVSGIILLFERPVRTGDWVAVGSTEGIVKNIRVRSTEIQTWDRTDVIIPNSEFISQQVTNYTLRDPYGRLTIPVRVAYGSDTHLVKSILESVAYDHAEVICNGRNEIPIPNVLFREFGDSSLVFHLRCFIRDIKERLQVISDINFEIDKRFRENNIDVPFPQRDLHLKSSIVVPHFQSSDTQTGQ